MSSKGDGGWLGKADRAESTARKNVHNRQIHKEESRNTQIHKVESRACKIPYCTLNRIELGRMFGNVDGVQMIEMGTMCTW